MKYGLYVVSVIGKPNIGKSTLINRICLSKEAIVHEQPMITRDRKYYEAEMCEYCDAKPLRNEPILLAGTGPALPAARSKPLRNSRRRRFCRYHALRHKNTCQPRLLRTGVCGRRRRRGIRTSAFCGYFCGTPSRHLPVGVPRHRISRSGRQ